MVDDVYEIVVEMELEAASDCVMVTVIERVGVMVGLRLIEVEGGAITS